MSDEDEKLLEETFITKLGAKYPWVKATGWKDKYQIKGYPTVLLISPDGVVKYNDHGTPPEDMIEGLLKDVSLAPKLPEGSQYAPLKALWEKRDHVKLRDWLDKMLAQPNLDAAMREVFEGQKDLLAKRAEAQEKRVATLGAGPDYAAAADQLEKIEKTWRGFPASDAAKKELARFAADPVVKKEISAGKALQKLLAGYDTSKHSDVKKLLVELPKFSKKYEGTHASKQAEEQKQRLFGKG